MGGGESKSTVKEVNNQLYINKEDVNILNQNSNSVIANTIIENALKSGTSIINRQSLVIKNIRTDGDFVLNSSQNQKASLTFEGMNQTQARNDAAVSFITQTLADLKNNVSTDILSKLEAVAASKNTSGFGATGGSSKSKTDITNNITSINETNKNISNILSNEVTNNFTTQNVTECVNTITNAQSVVIEDVVAKQSFTAFLSQEQVAESMAKCSSIVTATQTIINDTLNTLGIQVADTTATTSTTDITGTATSENVSQGPFESLGGMFGTIFTSLGSMFSSILTGAMAPYAASSASIVICLCCCCCCLIMIMMVMSMSGGSSK